MELVYLWVEKYKNIKNQGFNFSPRFKCEFFPKYDKDRKLGKDCELKITPKDYVSIFPNNINVTAIVGENGSGKSSIVEFLEHIDSYTGELYLKYRKRFIFLFALNNKKKLKLITNIDELKQNNLYEIIKVKPMQEDANSFPEAKEKVYMDFGKKALGRVSYKNPFTFEPYFLFLTLFSEMPYPFINTRNLKILRGKTINYENTNIANILIHNINKDFSFELTSFILYPKKIWLNDNNDLKARILSNIKEIKINSSINYQNQIRKEKLNPNNSLEAYMIEKIINSNLCEKFFENYTNTDNEKVIQDYFSQQNLNLNYNLIEYEKFISKQYIDLENIKEEEKKLIENYKEFLNFDFEDKKGRKISDFSHGERTLFSQFVSILDYVKKENNILLVFDEPEIAFHPNWQKRYLFEFMNMVSKLNKNIHLVITSHSPFILSDLPKENVIFLEKYKENDDEVKKDNQKEGNCKNVTKDIKLKTFGANIHTLLSDGFFMSDGLMGAFAKSKIGEIKKFYELVKKCERVINESEKTKNTIKNIYQGYEPNFRNIQKIIGEPFLQTIIKNYLDELEILFNGKKEFLDKEIERLQELRKELK